MSETLRDLVVSLSLNSDNFTRNIKSINKQIQEAESAFRLASAGVENFETTTAGLSSKLSTLQRTFQLQQDAVGQYERALQQASDKLQECYTRQNDYAQRLTELDQELRDGLADLPRKDIITFHEAFPYFARAYGLNVVGVVNREPGDALSPAQLAELVGVVEELGTPPLFVEPQYDDLAARTLAQETGAEVYTLDPVVTGPTDETALTRYEDVMRENMRTLQQALGE